MQLGILEGGAIIKWTIEKGDVQAWKRIVYPTLLLSFRITIPMLLFKADFGVLVNKTKYSNI